MSDAATSRMLPIPAFDYLRELAEYRPQLDAALARVLDSGSLILGQEVRSFEEEFARLVGMQYAIGVASGTDAISLALRAMGVGYGDGVVTVANTAVPTVSAIRAVGGVPIFVDIDPLTLQMSVERLRDVLSATRTPRVSCILPVHLHGQAADMQQILKIAKEHQLPVVGDCAQAHGTLIEERHVAAWSAVSCFSFYPTKNLAAFGDGGMCVTNSLPLAETLRELRQYGFRHDRTAYREGVCSRLDELQAALLRVRLRYFHTAQQARQRIAIRYQQGLAECDLRLPAMVAGTTHGWHQFVIRSPQRSAVCAALQRAQIGFGIHYPMPIHLMPAYEFLGYHRGELPHTEQAADEILSLPLFPCLREEEVERVIQTMRSVLA
jgi:aminotransferase EvaB